MGVCGRGRCPPCAPLIPLTFNKTHKQKKQDSNAPTWANNLDGHVNLRDALRRTATYTAPGANGGKYYKLRPSPELATLLVRPRGWHMEEKHFLVDGQPCSASLFDFGLFFFHNARQVMPDVYVV